MSELIVASFENKEQAEEVRTKLLELQREHLVDLGDAVVAVRDDNGKVKLYQNNSLITAGAASGGFWGALIGLLFLSPLLGLAIGAGTGAIAGALADVGINDDFMKELARKLQPGRSALFVLVRRATPDKLVEELTPFDGEIMRTSLSHEDEQRLRSVLEANTPVQTV